MNVIRGKMEVKVIRSPNRKKTVQAKVVGGTLLVYLPLGINSDEERKLIARMKEKIEKKQLKSRINRECCLRERFDYFNRKYFQGELRASSIEFVTNQESKIGSCTPSRGSIRISHKLLTMPRWVLDYVIMHEMTHLIYSNHSKAFWAKAGEYKYTERARGFLIAKGMEETEPEQLK